ncbi:KdsC family phosphatase [Natronospora cellulosivora (SeqCode)]
MKTSLDFIKKAKNIKMLIMDVDGTLTDGKIYLGNQGEELKTFNVKDGLGIKLLEEYNISTALITGRKSKIVDLRARELGIKEVHQGIDSKIEVYNYLKKKYNIEDKEIAYVGDDINDFELLKKVGLSLTLNDAIPEVKEECDFISSKKGGEGAVREIIDYIIESKNISRVD